MKQTPDDQPLPTGQPENVPQDIWAIYQLICRALHQKNALAFEQELAHIEAAIRLAGATRALDRGAEPFWMQDVRLAQRKIELKRLRAAQLGGD